MSESPDSVTSVDVDVEQGESSISTGDTMRERAGENRLKIWLLMGSNRLIVTGVLAAFVFVGFVLAGIFLYPPFDILAAQTDVIDTMFSTMISALITAVTLIVTISQLVISQENGPLGDQRQRMSNTLDYRTYASGLIETTTPSDPSKFLRSLVDASEQRAEALREAVADLADEEGGDAEDLAEEVDEFVDSVSGNSQAVRDQLDGAKFGTFDVVFAALNYNYGWKMFQVERMRDEYGDVLGDREQDLFDELHSSFAMFGPAREHVKTLYFQWALVSLTQMIVYVAIPALVVAGAMLAFVNPSSFPGATLGISDILWVVGGAFTFTLVPFLLFVAYVTRVATAAKRTLAIGPLILRDSQR